MAASADLPVMLAVEIPTRVLGDFPPQHPIPFPESDSKLKSPSIIRQGNNHCIGACSPHLCQCIRQVGKWEMLQYLKSNHRVKTVAADHLIEVAHITDQVCAQSFIEIAGGHSDV